MILDAYENRELFDFWMNKCIGCDAQPGLSAEEAALLTFLEKHSTSTIEKGTRDYSRDRCADA